MSLVNDALKRVSENKLPPQAEVNGDLRPAEHRPRSVWMWVWCAAGLMFAGFLAVWAILIGVVANNQLQKNNYPSKTEVIQVAAETAQSQAIKEPVKTEVPALTVASPAEKPLGPSVEPTSVVATNSAVAAPTNTVVAVVEPAKPAAPALKLQGIMWKTSKPLAMINAKMVGRGDKILGAKVVGIDQESVTLDRDGETLVLTLP